jgi:FtsP/CotA-like multicopper oxidase with cupredoxin domain
MRDFQRSFPSLLMGAAIVAVLSVWSAAQSSNVGLGGTAVAPISNPCPRTTTAGGVVQNPPALFSQNGVLNVQFTYQSTTDSSGRGLWCLTTPDGLQEPTLYVNPGDTLNITVTNNTQASPLGEIFNAPNCGDSQVGFVSQPFGDPVVGSATNIHFHGTNTSPACGGDNVVKTIINSGATFQYSISFPANEPPGLYWYHPHIHGLAERDVQGGASGAIVVQGIQNFQPAVAGLEQRILIVRDMPTTQGLPETSPPVNNPVETPNLDLSLNYIPENAVTNTTTGVTTFTPAVLNMQPGQTQFWRICNCTSDTILDLQLLFNGTPQTFRVVGIDAVPVNSQDGTEAGSPIAVTDYHLPPAARVEILATAPTSSATVAQLVTNYIPTGPNGDEDPTRALFTIQLTGDDTSSSVADNKVPQSWGRDTQPRMFAGLSSAPVQATHHLNFQELSNGSSFYINIDAQPYPVNTVFDPNNPPAIMIQQGSVQKWILQNQAMENHEFHQHQIHFMVLSQDNFEINGSTQAPAITGQFADMVQVPFWNGNTSTPFPDVQMLMDFRGLVVGDFVFHCHILGHEDLGMMAIEQVNAAAGKAEPSQDNKTAALADKKPTPFTLPQITERVISTGGGGLP